LLPVLNAAQDDNVVLLLDPPSNSLLIKEEISGEYASEECMNGGSPSRWLRRTDFCGQASAPDAHRFRLQAQFSFDRQFGKRQDAGK